MNMNDGGPAFPQSVHRSDRGMEWVESEDGMTLRDYFAAKAMASMIGTSAAPTYVGGLEGAESYCAVAAYKMADAMLVARNKEQTK
ncbi:MAG TPA: hypothetical protein VFF71_11905 [Luteimonas sp.]|nr:hypothetical protein [Luteimonas sp.]